MTKLLHFKSKIIESKDHLFPGWQELKITAGREGRVDRRWQKIGAGQKNGTLSNRNTRIFMVLGWYHDCALQCVMLGPTGAQLERYMDLLSTRQKLVASNIANMDTPGYLTQDIDFQSEFQNATGGAPGARTVEGLAVRNDGNNVSIDRETRLLAENSLRFQAASSLLHSQIQIVRSAIKEGQSA